MANADGPKQPSPQTIKRLFGLSANLCAFPECHTLLVDPKSGSVVGEMCHIKGEKPGSPRHDPTQSNTERHGYDNLILLCNVHHKIVDDDEATYSVIRLSQMKEDHNARAAGSSPVGEVTTERFVSVAINSGTIDGSVISSHGQSGGQIAQQINNNNYYYGELSEKEPLRLEGKLDMAGDLEVIKAMGCPGMQFTVICRGSRQAKIRSASLLVDDVGVMEGMRSGFGVAFAYTPVEGSTETLVVTLIPLSRRNADEGYVLNRDDVARFFYPLPLPSTTLALRAKPENVSVVVEFFDNSEQVVVSGEPVQQVLQDLYRVYQKRHGEPTVRIQFEVRVKSTTPAGPEMADLIGQVNSKYVPMAKPADESSPNAPSAEKP